MSIYNKLFDLVYYEAPDTFKQLMFYLPVELKLGGKAFRKAYNFIKSTEFLPREKLLKIQEKLLKKVLMYAVSKVPFYKRLGITISSTDNAFKVIRKFPIIDKELVKENLGLFISTDISKMNVYHTSTGGTTGVKLDLYVNVDAFAKEWAFMVRMWERIGYRLGDKVITFRGVKIKGASKGIYWQLQPLYNALEMSPFHLNYETAPLYIKKIIEWNPKFIHGYPSAITLLAKFVKELGISEKLPQIKAVLLTSENIYPWQRKLIEEAFNTRVFSWYGQTEKVVLAGECEYSTLYHVFPQYGFMELVDESGDLVDMNEEGEIVGTSFLNLAMPLIRYKTGDFAKISDEKCKCGRHYVLLEYVKGRRNFEDLVVGKKSIFNLSGLIGAIHSDVFRNCERFQIHQDTPGKIVIKIIPRKGKFSPKDVSKIIREIKVRVGDELDVEVDPSGDIYIAPSGKVPLVVQKLNISKYL